MPRRRSPSSSRRACGSRWSWRFCSSPDWRCHFSLAEELERNLRFDEARRHNARAVALNPDHKRALMRFAAIESRRPADDPRTLAFCDEARQAMAAGNHREALGRLAEAVERAPESAMPHHYLANVYYLLNDPRRSMDHLERAVELAPGNRLLRENLRILRRPRQTPE